MEGVKEVVFLSGKGGAGKTSILGGIYSLMNGKKAVVDCDVDAANLFLILRGQVKEEKPFYGSKKAEIKRDKCKECGLCKDICSFGAINEFLMVDPILCEGCGSCFVFCPHSAVSLEEKRAGTIYIGETKRGDLFLYAELFPGEENSGKLVQALREEARKRAKEMGFSLILMDGSPGIGCPVISSVAGVDLMVALCEPQSSSIHDLLRLLELSEHFRIKTALVINKSDVNPWLSEKLKRIAEEKGLPLLGEIPYDPLITEAQREGKTIVEYSRDSKSSKALQRVYERFSKILEELR
jgi:MinD superfamily P-loop ATPase